MPHIVVRPGQAGSGGNPWNLIFVARGSKEYEPARFIARIITGTREPATDVTTRLQQSGPCESAAWLSFWKLVEPRAQMHGQPRHPLPRVVKGKKLGKPRRAKNSKYSKSRRRCSLDDKYRISKAAAQWHGKGNKAHTTNSLVAVETPMTRDTAHWRSNEKALVEKALVTSFEPCIPPDELATGLSVSDHGPMTVPRALNRTDQAGCWSWTRVCRACRVQVLTGTKGFCSY